MAKIKRHKIHVNFFQRRPRPGFNFSIEQIFESIRFALGSKITFTVFISRYYNTGYSSKLANIIGAYFNQNSGLNHISGEVHFLNLLLKKKRTILTIHDCGMMKRKTGTAKKIVNWLYLKAPVGRAAVVTTVSNKTKEEVVAFTGCDPNKIIVIPNPIGKHFINEERAFNANSPRILHIGTAPNKNLERLIPALQGLNCILTIVGRLRDNQISLLSQFDISYQNLYNISDYEMLECYKQCDILSFVSISEGFGMPIIEANVVGRVVITSNASSMPEVANGAAHLVDPYDIQDIRKGFLKIMEDENYRKTLITAGYKNKKRFEASVIAEQYYELYKELHSLN